VYKKLYLYISGSGMNLFLIFHSQLAINYTK